jgi:hypothetical protein
VQPDQFLDPHVNQIGRIVQYLGRAVDGMGRVMARLPVVGRYLQVGTNGLVVAVERLRRHLGRGIGRPPQGGTKVLDDGEQHYSVPSGDFHWGWLHRGVKRIPGLTQLTPSDFTCWISPQLESFWRDSYYEQLDNDLAAAGPVLRCACTYRARYWQIALDDFATGLQLIEALWTEEPGEWSPSSVL